MWKITSLATAAIVIVTMAPIVGVEGGVELIGLVIGQFSQN